MNSMNKRLHCEQQLRRWRSREKTTSGANGVMTVLRFRASLAGTRKLSLTYYTEADKTGGEANTLEIRERLPDGNEQLLVRRMRVPYGRGLKEDSAFSFHPYGGADSNDRPSRHQKLNWPAAVSECLLRTATGRAGRACGWPSVASASRRHRKAVPFVPTHPRYVVSVWYE